MITVTFFQKDTQLAGFTCSGHAGFAPEGEDIVCAAVSALVLNTVNSVEALTDCPFLQEHSPDGGYIKLLLEEENPDARLLLKSLKLGLTQIRDESGSGYLKIRQCRLPSEEKPE